MYNKIVVRQNCRASLYRWKNYTSSCSLLKEGIEGKECYIRFGDLPPNERSKNHLTGKLEAGVSVYDGLICEGKVLPVLPDLSGSILVGFSGCLGKPSYLVVGDKIGLGSDGEPLLINVKIVKPVEIKEEEE